MSTEHDCATECGGMFEVPGHKLTEMRDQITNLTAELATARQGLADVSRMTHQLADIDQIVTEAQMDAAWYGHAHWIAMLDKLRAAVDGTDYKPKEAS